MGYKAERKKILIISQWHGIKNAEFQLIECMKQAAFDFTVVDCLGFDINTRKNINNENLNKEFEFAVALHFDTPKLLNIRTYFWVANPLEYLYLKPEYSYNTINNIRSHDDYLFNGSDVLKQQIKNLLGEAFCDSSLFLYPSSAISKICSPDSVAAKRKDNGIPKVFYCGINWEKIQDKNSRNQGLLSLLESKDIIDIFGNERLKEFSSYKGNIPFDASSLAVAMQQYQAVLSISSPAHIRSETTSSRVFEGISAGVPVISDRNAHVEKLFGPLVYYYDGDTDLEKCESIAHCLRQIRDNKEDAQGRVKKAQDLIRDKYSFDVCLGNIISKSESRRASSLTSSLKRRSTQIILYHHDPTEKMKLEDVSFDNIKYCLLALGKQLGCDEKNFLTLICACKSKLTFSSDKALQEIAKESGVEIEIIHPDHVGLPNWNKEKLGAKIASMIDCIRADSVSFINSYEYPHYDFFDKYHARGNNENLIFVSGGFYRWPPSDRFKQSIARSWATIRNNHLGRSSDDRFNQSEASYVWSRASIGNNHLGRMILPRSFLTKDLAQKLTFFDLMLPCVLLILAQDSGYEHYRSRFMTLFMKRNVLEDYYKHLEVVTRDQGFWGSHYFLISNADQEANAGFDLCSSSEAVQKWRSVVFSPATESPQSINSNDHQTIKYLTKLLLPSMRLYSTVKRILRSLFSRTPA